MRISVPSRAGAGRATSGELGVEVRRELGRSDATTGLGEVVYVHDSHPLAGGSHAGTLGGCVFDGVFDSSAEPAALVDWAYRSLAPGAPLVVTLAGSPSPTSRRRQAGGRRPAGKMDSDRARSLLFAGGFVRPRLVKGRGWYVISAIRGSAAPPAKRRQLLSVVLPVYNERETFGKVMEQLVDKEIPGVDIEVIVVESNSSDGTRDEALRYADHPRVRLVLQESARGKGNAVRAGLAEAVGDFVVIQDADLEYDMDDYEVLLQPLRQFESAFVLGVRSVAGHMWRIRRFETRSLVAPMMNLGHLGFRTLFNVVYGQRLQDPFTMYKVMRRDALYRLQFECNRFDFDWELTGKLVRAGYPPTELPVTYRSRSFAEGKKVSLFRDPLTWVVACFKYRFSPLYQDR